MIKVDKLKPNFNLYPNLKKAIFLSKQGRKKINREWDIHLFDKILSNFEISTPILQKSSYNIAMLYIKSLYRIENVNFNTKKILSS